MRPLELACLVTLFAANLAARADPVDLKPFRADYTLEWKGITVGGSTLELKTSGNNTYSYSAVSAARGVFRMAFSDSIRQASTFSIIGGRVVPQRFEGIDEKEHPTDLTFDWQRKHVSGVAKGHSVDLELPDGAQDPMSLQIASLRSLASADLQDKVWLVDSDKLKDYELLREGTAQIETELGKLDTVIYSSKRTGSDRITRTWVAPALGYLPVRAERVKGTKVEFTLLIQNANR